MKLKFNWDIHGEDNYETSFISIHQIPSFIAQSILESQGKTYSLGGGTSQGEICNIQIQVLLRRGEDSNLSCLFWRQGQIVYNERQEVTRVRGEPLQGETDHKVIRARKGKNRGNHLIFPTDGSENRDMVSARRESPRKERGPLKASSKVLCG